MTNPSRTRPTWWTPGAGMGFCLSQSTLDAATVRAIFSIRNGFKIEGPGLESDGLDLDWPDGGMSNPLPGDIPFHALKYRS